MPPPAPVSVSIGSDSEPVKGRATALAPFAAGVEWLHFALRVLVNIFNRTYLNNPTVTGFSLPQTQVNGQNTGGFGYINLATPGTQAGQPRNGTLVARFTF